MILDMEKTIEFRKDDPKIRQKGISVPLNSRKNIFN